MKRTSRQWMESISRYQNGAGNADVLTTNFPLLPWITPALPPRIVELIEQLGICRKLQADQYLFSPDEKISSLVYVRHGVTGRALGDPYGQTKQAIAISPPRHLAAGNLNFFSHRQAVGRYFAITPAEVVFCPRKLLESIILSDPDLFKLFVLQFECTVLSDRLGFACLSLLDSEDRLNVLSLVWAANFGEKICINDEEWVKMPFPLSRETRARVTSTSLFWVDRKLKGWKEEGWWQRKGDWVWFKVDRLEPVYSWLMHAGEQHCDFDYPDSFSALLDRCTGIR